MKAGRFVIDTHVHAQRFAAGAKLREAMAGAKNPGKQWEALSHVMSDMRPYLNTERLLFDMDTYRVDMAVLLPAFGMSNDLNVQLVEQYPDKFVAVCNAHDYLEKVRSGEVEWRIEDVCADLDRLLSTGKFVGIGEVSPYMPVPADRRKLILQTELIENMLAICEVGNKHGVTVGVHSGCPMGYDVAYSSGSLGPINFNPLMVHDLAAAFPNLKIIIDHGGMQGWWSEKIYEDCLHVAAARDNVYLETGLWWRELYTKPLMDPNIGPEKLIWGTDWGASINFHTQLDSYPPSYAVQLRKKGPSNHQTDYWGWSLREVTSIRMSQDDRNLIVGGNACRIFGIKPPHKHIFRDFGP